MSLVPFRSLPWCEQLRQARREMRLSQVKLGKKLGISGRMVGYLEFGSRLPTLPLARRIEYVCGVRAEDTDLSPKEPDELLTAVTKAWQSAREGKVTSLVVDGVRFTARPVRKAA